MSLAPLVLTYCFAESAHAKSSNILAADGIQAGFMSFLEVIAVDYRDDNHMGFGFHLKNKSQNLSFVFDHALNKKSDVEVSLQKKLFRNRTV